MQKLALSRSVRFYFGVVNGLLWGSVSLRWVLEFIENNHPQTNLLSILLLLFGGLMFFKESRAGQLLNTHLFLTVQTLLVFGASLLYFDLDFFAILYLPLTIQAGLLLERPRARMWFAIFILFSIVGQHFQFGWPASLPFSLLYIAAIITVVLLIENTLNSQAAKEQIEKLLLELKAANLQITALAEQAEEMAVLEERNRLARELHDSVAQTLYGLNLRSEAALRKWRDGITDGMADYLDDFQQSTQRTLQETRLLIHELRPDTLRENGLKIALMKRLENVERRSGVELILRMDEVENMPTKLEFALYQIAVEALNNTLKHARANQVAINLVCKDAVIHMAIQDDGVGLPKAFQGGLGIQGMRERAAQVDAKISIASPGLAGRGTSVSVEVLL
jgi:signal transduction histidine kinase